MTQTPDHKPNANRLPTSADLRRWAQDLGFSDCSVASPDLGIHADRLQEWLQAGHHGEMDYMQRYGESRSQPEAIVPGTKSILVVRMDYAPPALAGAEATLEDPARAYVSRYALGRDYHKLLRKRLQQLADHIQASIGPFGHRVFVDSGPVMEKALAAESGLGWIGKHTNLIERESGSWFFLGVLLTDLELSPTETQDDHCGTCTRCIEVCPTQAIIAPYQLDARRCISYLTIELHGAIPEEFRKPMGNRIYGCDDCQLVCPWNRFTQYTREADFLPRHNLDQARLLELFAWDEAEFLRKSEGSALRRLGYVRWMRNLAVALGNAEKDLAISEALLAHRGIIDPLVDEHIDWALAQQEQNPINTNS